MSDRVNREMLRTALIDQVPEFPAVAGRICLAAVRRAGLEDELDFTGNTCYFASEAFSTNCFGEVDATGTEVTGSEATGGGCLRVEQVDADLVSMEEIAGPIGQQ